MIASRNKTRSQTPLLVASIVVSVLKVMSVGLVVWLTMYCLTVLSTTASFQTIVSLHPKDYPYADALYDARLLALVRRAYSHMYVLSSLFMLNYAELLLTSWTNRQAFMNNRAAIMIGLVSSSVLFVTNVAITSLLWSQYPHNVDLTI